MFALGISNQSLCDGQVSVFLKRTGLCLLGRDSRVNDSRREEQAEEARTGR